MKRYFYRFSGLMVVALVAIAKIGITPLCFFSHYQPEVPDCLRK
ncbi:MAG: cyclic lactone autoinducer peptide [Syntrophomonadaceae bacterium]|jgi:cyclic lactone autoinducer peptide|nr:cyclic lactone autoinducer peptide [Syntrophomonadaceae bacterium]